MKKVFRIWINYKIKLYGKIVSCLWIMTASCSWKIFFWYCQMPAVYRKVIFISWLSHGFKPAATHIFIWKFCCHQLWGLWQVKVTWRDRNFRVLGLFALWTAADCFVGGLLILSVDTADGLPWLSWHLTSKGVAGFLLYPWSINCIQAKSVFHITNQWLAKGIGMCQHDTAVFSVFMVLVLSYSSLANHVYEFCMKLLKMIDVGLPYIVSA